MDLNDQPASHALESGAIPGGYDVFISYAREDRSFVENLRDALAADGHQTWVDWEGIPASAEWMAEVRGAIDASSVFCYVISPASVESSVCREEVAYAASSSKRILPVLARVVPADVVPDIVAAHHWIDFTDPQQADHAFRSLSKAVSTDLEWARAHSRLLVRAKEWDLASRDQELLLRGSDLSDAETWLAHADGQEPHPTALQVSYLLASRRSATGRQRVGIAVPLLLYGILVCAASPLYIQVVDPATDLFGQRSPAGQPITTGVGFGAFLEPLGGGIRGVYWVFALLVGSLATTAWYSWQNALGGVGARAVGAASPFVAGALLLVASAFAVAAGPLKAVPLWKLTANGNAVLLVIGAGLLALAWSERSRLLAVVSVIYLAVSCLCILYNPENQFYNLLSLLGVSSTDMPIGQSQALPVLLPGVVLLTGAIIAGWPNSKSA